MNLNHPDLTNLIGSYSSEEQYRIVERLGIMYEDRPVTKQQAQEVADTVKIELN